MLQEHPASVLLQLEHHILGGRTEVVGIRERYKVMRTRYAMSLTFNTKVSTPSLKTSKAGTYQNPVKLSAKYNGPNSAGLLLYLTNNCMLVQSI